MVKLAQMATKDNLEKVVFICEGSRVRASPWRSSFKSGKEWGLSPKTNVLVLHTAELDVTAQNGVIRDETLLPLQVPIRISCMIAAENDLDASAAQNGDHSFQCLFQELGTKSKLCYIVFFSVLDRIDNSSPIHNLGMLNVSFIVTFTVTATTAASIFTFAVVPLLLSRGFVSFLVITDSRYAVGHASFFLFWANRFWASVVSMPIVVLIMVVYLVCHLLVSRIRHVFHFVDVRVFVFITVAPGAGDTFVLGIGRGMLMVIFGVVSWFLVATCDTCVLVMDWGMVLLGDVFGAVNRPLALN
ncbi:hypothetical protein Tco_0805263 [Tanacetum coccineum]